LDASARILVLYCIDQLDVAKRSRQLSNRSRNPLVTFSAQTLRPLHRCPAAHLVLPLGTYFGEVIRPNECRSAAVGTMHHDDVLVGKVDAGISGRNGLVI